MKKKTAEIIQEEEFLGLPVQDVLRILFVAVVFFFVEFHFARTTFTSPQILRFPLFDIDLTGRSLLFQGMEILYLALTLSLCWRQLLQPLGYLTAVVAVVLINLDLRGRYQFDYLPMWTFLCFAISDALSKNEKTKSWVALPFVIVFSVIYDFSVIHKALNFHYMLTDLPGEVYQQSDGFFGPLCSDRTCWILTMVTWFTIPIEMTMGILMLSKKFLRERLAVAILFHWMVAIMAEVIAVSFMMLLLHVYIAHLQRPDVRIFKDRKWKPLLVFEAVMFVGARYAVNLDPHFGVMMTKICWVNLFLAPIIFLIIPYLRELKSEKPNFSLATPLWLKSALRPGSVPEAILAIFLAVQILFGFAPLMMKEPYSTYNIGWGMFSGGYLQNPIHTLQVPKKPCAMFPNVAGVLTGRQTDDEIIYTAKRQIDLDRLNSYIQSRCSQSK